jgi:hypothetical protein
MATQVLISVAHLPPHCHLIRRQNAPYFQFLTDPHADLCGLRLRKSPDALLYNLFARAVRIQGFFQSELCVTKLAIDLLSLLAVLLSDGADSLPLFRTEV